LILNKFKKRNNINIKQYYNYNKYKYKYKYIYYNYMNKLVMHKLLINKNIPINNINSINQTKYINNNPTNNIDNTYILDEYHKIDYPPNKFNKTLILYVFNQFNDRVTNFINKCIFKDNKFDFIFIINDKNFHISILQLPDHIKYILRDNIGFDFGGWSEGLLKNNLYKNYDSFIFINSSVYGPCMENTDTRKWPDILLNGLNYNDIKLFGTTINCMNKPETNSHVQSMVFCMDINTLEYLISKNIFSIKIFEKNMGDTIHNREIRMSREIINNNWNIGCLHTYYNNIDFRFKIHQKSTNYFLGDLCNKNIFFGKTIHPYEILFVKGNRNIEYNFIKKYIKC
jgi:hypothetical protein